MPFSVMVSTVPPGTTRSTSTTASSSASLIERTPTASLPIALTSFSLKRMLWPLRVPMMKSSSPPENRTPMSSSSSLRPTALSPVLRMFAKSDSFVFLITPLRVAITRYLSSSLSLTGSTADTDSPPASCSRFTIATPLAERPASGIS
ncbi:hypothetical protein SDC9_180159 [bioreactor metagenome]|uniref:Uncharacterized protein n=1 Tax=bioreactor metagenome TaxID=1076179 RepID=A0A645H3V4_9ZZZZ